MPLRTHDLALLAAAFACACDVGPQPQDPSFDTTATTSQVGSTSGVDEDADSESSPAGTSGAQPGGSTTGASGGESGGEESSSGGPEIPLAPTCDDATVMTSSLGWSAGEDVGPALAELLASLEPGAVVCVEELYDLSPAPQPYLIPEGVTIAAHVDAGFRALNVPGISNQGMFELGSDVALSNLTVLDEGELTGDDAALYNNKILFAANGATGIIVSQCRFDVYTKTIMRFNDVSGAVIDGTHLAHSYYQLAINGVSEDVTITGSLFEHSEGDGIKTGYRNASDVNGIHVDGCAFEHNGRDGIDTTGGFRGSVVENTLFLDLFAGLDIKTIYEQESDAASVANNRDITIRDCDFVNPGTGAIVVTTLDRLGFVDDDNASAQLSHAIEVSDSVVEQRDRESRAMLIKDGHDITWSGLELLGGAAESRIFGLAEPGDYGDRPLLSQTNWNIEVSGVTTGPARDAPPQRPFDVVGPR